MKAHWLNDGESVLVTGTLDPETAKAFLEDLEPDMFAFAEDHAGRADRGNIIPQHPEADYRWVWMSANKGRCRAVMFE